MIEKVESGTELIALVIRSGFRSDGIEFFTPESFSQQLAYMNRPTGYHVAPHRHREIQREVMRTQEVLFIKSGRVRVELYDRNDRYLEQLVLTAGDTILLAGGGHGITMLEPTEMIEVKQGPYSGKNDKIAITTRAPEDFASE